jgi:hypothetical protein
MGSDRRSVVRWWAILVLALVSAVTTTVPASAGADRGPRPLRVMTQNLYLGASLTPALQATTTSGFLAAVAGTYRSSRDNDFSVRAAAVAEEIHTHRPDLIG